METQQKNKTFLRVGIVAVVAIAAIGVVVAVLAGTYTPAPAQIAETTQAATVPPTTEAQPLLPANPYGMADFRYENGFLTCTAGQSVLGIDVSEFQGEIDYTAVREAGVEFVMIRLGYRGYSSGALNTDAYAQQNYDAAREAGLKVGAYFFSQAVDTAEAEEEAAFALALTDGWEMDMPLVFDWEYISDEARTAAIDDRALTDIAKAFCEAVRGGGRRPMVYFNFSLSQDLLLLEELTDYPFWLAMYSNEMTYPYKIAMWQYSCTGQVPGVAADVDINLYFPELEEGT